MSYPFTAFSLRYEWDVVRLLSSPNWFGPMPTIGCSWREIRSFRQDNSKATVGRYLQKRHGSSPSKRTEWRELWRDHRIFPELDRRIPIEDPERPVRRQAPPRPIDWERIKEWYKTNGMHPENDPLTDRQSLRDAKANASSLQAVPFSGRRQ